MLKQIQWLKELICKKPREYEEYFYSDIQHYFGIEFEDEKSDMIILFNLCGDYAKELIICKNKREVKKWLNEIALYVINKLEVDYVIENYLASKRKITNDSILDNFKPN